jgi:hypothetical protein
MAPQPNAAGHQSKSTAPLSIARREGIRPPRRVPKRKGVRSSGSSPVGGVTSCGVLLFGAGVIGGAFSGFGNLLHGLRAGRAAAPNTLG